MKPNWSSSIRVVSIFTLCLASAGFAQSLSLEKTTFTPGEDIQVTFTALATYAPSAWVGIIPSKVEHGSAKLNDQNNRGYQYLNKRASGILAFKAPDQPGAYDFRLTNEDNYERGREVASVSFTVTPPIAIEKISFAPGEDIQVKFTASPSCTPTAWIGIVPSQIKHGDEALNDQNKKGYEYLKSRTSGTMVLKAPTEPGDYDLRLNDADDHEKGHEVFSAFFTVQ